MKKLFILSSVFFLLLLACESSNNKKAKRSEDSDFRDTVYTEKETRSIKNNKVIESEKEKADKQRELEYKLLQDE